MRVTAARSLCDSLLHSVLETHEKRQLLEGVWPRVLTSMVREALQECSSLDSHMQALLDRL